MNFSKLLRIFTQIALMILILRDMETPISFLRLAVLYLLIITPIPFDNEEQDGDKK